MGAQRFGKYVATRLVHRSERAEVYEATDPVLDRRVAIKVFLTPAPPGGPFADAFRAEAVRIAALRHPNIVPFYDFDTSEDGAPFIVTEYLSGGTLRDRLAELRQAGRMLPLQEATRILDGVAAALDHAHAHGVVHGAVKPGNVLFTTAGEPVLTDFGVARTLARLGVGDAIPATYMSPEQAAGETPTAASDVYCLGVLLYEMVTGHVPFQGPTYEAVVEQHKGAPPPPPRQFAPDLPESAEPVILRALGKDPAERFRSAGELARAFKSALTTKPAPAQGEAPARPKEDWLVKLARMVGVIAPLAGKAAPSVQEAPSDFRSRLAVILGIISIVFAAYQMVGQLFKVILSPIAPLTKYFPYVIVPLFLAGAGLALVAALRTPAGVRRRRAFAVFGVIAAAGLIWGTWSAYNRLRPPSGYIVVLADIRRTDATLPWVDFAGHFEQYLESELTGLETTVRVVRTHEAYDSAGAARAAGVAHKATLVIWGWYDSRGVSIRAEALRVPTVSHEAVGLPLIGQSLLYAVSGGLVGAPEAGVSDVARFVRVPATLTDFEVFALNGPQQVAYVSTAILGMAFFINKDMEHALVMFDKAIAHSESGGAAIVRADAVYFQRSYVLYTMGRLDESVADLRRVLTLKPDSYEAHYNLAIALAEVCTPARQLDAAIAEAEAAVRLQPDVADAHMLLGDLYRQRGAYEDALAQFQRAAELAPDRPEPYELLSSVQSALGLTADAEKSRRTALALRQKAVGDKAVDAFQAHLGLADAYVAAGEYDKAIAEYQAASTLKPDDYRVHWGLGNAYYWSGKADQAEAEYKAWATGWPKDANAHLLLGLFYMEHAKTQEAIAELKQAAALAPCDPSAHLLLASIYFGQEDYGSAIHALEQARRIEPQDASTLYMLGNLYYLQGDLEDALQRLQDAVALKPDLAEAHYSLGLVYSDMGEDERSASEHALAVRYAPDDAAYHTALGNAYWRLQDWDKAAEAYRSALALEDNPDVRVYLGEVYAEQKQYDAAIAEYQKALAANPQSALAYAALGDAYVQMGRLRDALAAYTEQAKIADSAPLRRQMAVLHTVLGETDEAVAQYEKAVALDAQDWQSRAALGNLYLLLGRDGEAETEYRAALAVNPNSAEAHYGLARVAYRRCNLSDMEQSLKSAIAAAPGMALYKAALASAYEAKGRSDEAAAIYRELGAAPAEDALAHLFAGDYLLRQDDPDGAEAQLQLVLGVPNMPPLVLSLTHGLLGKVEYARGRLVAATSEFQAALKALPVNAEAQQALGDIALRGGDAEGALAAYEAAIALLPDYGRQVAGDEASLSAVNLEIRRGLALARRGATAESSAALDKAVAVAQDLANRMPLWPRAHFVLALAYHAQGNSAGAEAEMAAATQCDQSLGAAWARAQADLAKLR